MLRMTWDNGMDAPLFNGIDVPKWSFKQPLNREERPK